MSLYCCPTCPALLKKLKLPNCLASIYSNKNKLLITLETNILMFFKCLLCANYFTKYFKFIIFVFNVRSKYLHIVSVFSWTLLYKFLSPTQFLVSGIITLKKYSFLLWYREYYPRKLNKKLRQSPWLPETRIPNRNSLCTNISLSMYIYLHISIRRDAK